MSGPQENVEPAELGPAAKAELDRAFEDFYRSHLRDVYSYAYYRVGNHHDAEDLTEQAFLQGDARAVATGPVRLDRAELARIYDPTNPLAGPDGSYQGSNVDLIVEIADAREANRSYEANLRMFDQARQMASSLLDLLRR